MSIPPSKTLDQATGQAKEAAIVPGSPITGIDNDTASATTKKPAMVPVSAGIFKDYQKHEWMRDLKPEELSAKDLPSIKEAPTIKAASTTKAAPTIKAAPNTTALLSLPTSSGEKSHRKSEVKSEQPLCEYEEVPAKPRPSYTIHQLAGRPSSKGDIPIKVCIGNLPTELPTNESWFPTILDVINLYTIQKPYACDASQMLDVGNAIIFRPVHNVTHSVRQVMLLRTLFDCLGIHGTGRVQEILKEISSTERFLLQLGVFCLRVGRVDETNARHPSSYSDGSMQRSAQIFSLYALQLPGSASIGDEISWVASLISVACKSDEVLPKAITKNDKSYLAVQLLASAHELDLYRCYNMHAMTEPIEKCKQFLFIQTDDHTKVNEIHPRLETYALALMAATGSAISYKKTGYDLPLFAANSLDAKYCWQTARSVEKPNW